AGVVGPQNRGRRGLSRRRGCRGEKRGWSDVGIALGTEFGRRLRGLGRYARGGLGAQAAHSRWREVALERLGEVLLDVSLSGPLRRPDVARLHVEGLQHPRKLARRTLGGPTLPASLLDVLPPELSPRLAFTGDEGIEQLGREPRGRLRCLVGRLLVLEQPALLAVPSRYGRQGIRARGSRGVLGADGPDRSEENDSE